MPARSVLQLYHAESDGDVLTQKTITITRPDGSPLGVAVYEQMTGGLPALSLETSNAGTELVYAEYADLDAAAVGRVKVSYSDAPSTTFDDAFWPDPLDLFVDGMTRNRSLAGGLTVSRDSASAALKATNSSTGTAFEAGDGFASLGALRVGKNGTNEIVSINLVNSILPASSSFLVAKTIPAGAGYVVSDCLADIGGASGDCGAMRAYIVQTVPGVGTGIRAGEFHTGRGSLAAGGLGTWILELGLHTAFAGAGVGDNVGIRLTSEPNAGFGADPAARANEAIFIVGGDGAGNGGWTNAIRYEEFGVVLFNVDLTGAVISGNHVSRGAATYDLGSSSNIWRIVYANTHMAEAGGDPATPTYTFRVAPTVGAYLGSGNAYCLSGGSAEKVRVDAAGVAFAAGHRVQENSVATITPPKITANTDNYNPPGLATASRLRLSTDASRNITGIVAQPAGTVLHLQNVDAFAIVLKNETTSTLANRLFLPGGVDATILPSGAYTLIYDGSLTRWLQYVG